MQDEHALDERRSSREPVRYLVFSASLRADSLNSRLAALAADTISALGGPVSYTHLTLPTILRV